MGGNARFLGGTGGKVRTKLKALIFPWKSEKIVPVLPWKVRSPLFHTFLTQITLPFI